MAEPTVNDRRNQPNADKLTPVGDQVRAWWVGVLATGRGVGHPIVGTRIQAKMKEDVLLVRGTVDTREEQQRIFQEAKALRGIGVRRVRMEVVVGDQKREADQLLAQTILSFFAGRLQAEFAQSLLEDQPDVDPLLSEIITDPGELATSRLLPSYWQKRTSRGLEEGRVLLAVQVDETRAFRARELLDEETRSILTVVLPPEPMPAAKTAARAEELRLGAERSGEPEEEMSMPLHDPTTGEKVDR